MFKGCFNLIMVVHHRISYSRSHSFYRCMSQINQLDDAACSLGAIVSCGES